ncbi:histidine--tRNA ligase [Lentilactobacillus senioris]|uniref:histidine--tRNA ligase n=1 Tax=Lentilactobacillus senioris TaxID=931534 RepID=UPI00227F6E86|nr:histidine--tRNA ligase [Lentilactobacillus senioris]MCY9806780.1 histidine--tRNA ligase [Lentilactobacillus senioris]
MKFQRPKGTADILPGESQKWNYIEETARSLFQDYRYSEIRTPLFENFEVFSRTSGDTSDVVTKEMYDFHDKGDRHISLRPEGTAGVVRAFVENKLYGPEFQKPYKVFYMGSMFRYERPQSGRLREFHQIGVEAFGSDASALDVEVIAMAMDLLTRFGLQNLHLVINTLGDQESRDAYRKALIDYLEPHFDELSEDSKVRLHKNPLRVLDSKDPKDQVFVADAPSILDYLTPEAVTHFEEVKQLLTDLNIAYEVDSTMVRGLDYYNHTIFEVMTSLDGSADLTTICAGGRYNGLVEELGGPEVSGVGFGLGIERLLLLMEAQHVTIPDLNELTAYVVGIGEETSATTLKIVQALRHNDITAERDYLNRKPKAQFKSANKDNAKFTITIGDNELANQTANVKSMTTGEEVAIPQAEIMTDFAKAVSTYFDL